MLPDPVPLPLPGGGGDHHELPRRPRPRALLVALGSRTDRLARRRWVATVARSGGRGEVQKAWDGDGLYCRLANVQRTTGIDDIANRQQIVRCALSTAGPPPRRIVAGARGVCTIVPQYNVRTTGQKGSRTYRENRHGGDVGDVDGDGDGVGGDGDGAGGGFDVDVMGGDRPTWGLLSSLSEPHDQPYLTHPYATEPSQFHDPTNPNTTPL